MDFKALFDRKKAPWLDSSPTMTTAVLASCEKCSVLSTGSVPFDDLKHEILSAWEIGLVLGLLGVILLASEWGWTTMSKRKTSNRYL